MSYESAARLVDEVRAILGKPELPLRKTIQPGIEHPEARDLALQARVDLAAYDAYITAAHMLCNKLDHDGTPEAELRPGQKCVRCGQVLKADDSERPKLLISID